MCGEINCLSAFSARVYATPTLCGVLWSMETVYVWIAFWTTVLVHSQVWQNAIPSDKEWPCGHCLCTLSSGTSVTSGWGGEYGKINLLSAVAQWTLVEMTIYWWVYCLTTMQYIHTYTHTYINICICYIQTIHTYIQTYSTYITMHTNSTVYTVLTIQYIRYNIQYIQCTQNNTVHYM
jgi:hypothetical protein